MVKKDSIENVGRQGAWGGVFPKKFQNNSW